MNRTDRLMAIVLELQANGPRRAEDLARAFETSKRTIYRDMEALAEAGVPVIAGDSGWALDEGYFLPPMAFTVDEATLLLLGANTVAGSFDAEYRAAAEAAGRKIQAVLPNAIRERAENLRDSLIFVSALTPGPAAETEALRLLRRAILRQQTVRFRYFTRYPGDGRVSLRDADPYSLVCHDSMWYLIGYCHQRKDMRTFKLSRMEDLTVTTRVFQPTAERTDLSRQESRDTRNVVIRLLFDEDAAPWVMEDRLYYIEQREPVPDGLAVTLRVRHLDEIFQWVMGWGRKVRVIEPDELRERLRDEARAMLEQPL
jgi:predicted DNA-binding transcriptional regulator YafY